MSLSSLYEHHADICDRMANEATTAEARQQWNDLAAELRKKADFLEGRIVVSVPATAELEDVPASNESVPEDDNGPSGPRYAEPPLPKSDLGFEPEVTPAVPPARSELEEAPSSEPGHSEVSDLFVPAETLANEEETPPPEHQAAQVGHTTPEAVETSDPEWEALIANIRLKKRPSKQD